MVIPPGTLQTERPGHHHRHHANPFHTHTRDVVLIDAPGTPNSSAT
jgi:hypothetical protein